MKKSTLSFVFFLTYFFCFTQTNVSGVISSDTTWGLSESPFLLTGSVLVVDGVNLTIEAGVVIKFNSGLYIKNEGTITAVGTSSEKITFKSNASSPQKSDWVGIKIRPTGGSTIGSNQDYSSGSQFKYVVIMHADTGLYIYDTGLHISNSEFENNNRAVEIRATEGVVIDNSIFTNNNVGIWS